MSSDTPPELPVSKPPDYPLMTRVAALWIWSWLSLLATGLTLWGTTTSDASPQGQYFEYLMRLSGGSGFGQPPPQALYATWLPVLSPLFLLIAYTALAFAWLYLYRFFRFYLLPIAFLNSPPPDRGVDPRQVIAVRSLRMTATLLGFAAIARVVPFLLMQILPHVMRIGV